MADEPLDHEPPSRAPRSRPRPPAGGRAAPRNDRTDRTGTRRPLRADPNGARRPLRAEPTGSRRPPRVEQTSEGDRRRSRADAASAGRQARAEPGSDWRRPRAEQASAPERRPIRTDQASSRRPPRRSGSSSRAATEREPLADRAAVRRRYRRRRALVGSGAVAVFVLLLGVCGVVYGVWRFNQIDRTDLDLPEAASGDPQNYLIVGSDSRAPATDVPEGGSKVAGPVEGKRSDTILVVRIDPDEQQAKMLSLPRDLWVTLADTGERQRINAAYNHGEQALVDTITAELDIPIHHFLEVDFNGFQGLVKAVDGVPMYFDRAMRDRNSGLEVLHPGCVTLDPTQALAFARSRHLEYMDDGEWSSDPTGDLGRISRQQLFIRRAVKRAVDKGPRNPLTLKRLVDVGAENVTVDDDLPVRDLLALGRRFADFDAEGLQTFTLPVDPDRTDGGADILRLREAEAEPVLALFRDERDASSEAGGREEQLELAAPTASVQVWNGSGVDGQAKQAKEWLQSVGYTVETTGNASAIGLDELDRTLIRYGSAGKGEADLLAARVVGADPNLEKDEQLEGDTLVLVTGPDFDGIRADDGHVLDEAAPSAGSGASADGTSTSTTEVDADDGGTPPTTTVVGRTPGEPPPGETC